MRSRHSLPLAAAFTLLVSCGARTAPQPETPSLRCPEISVFVREGCPHCTAAKAYLAEFSAREPGLKVSYLDVRADPANRDRLKILAGEHGIETIGVPSFLICGDFLAGFSETATPAEIERRVKQPAYP